MNALLCLDEGHLRQILAEEVPRLILGHVLPVLATAPRKEYLTPHEMGELTGMSRRQLQHLRDARRIPFVQHGRKVLYPTADVLAFLRVRHIEPRPLSRGGAR